MSYILDYKKWKSIFEQATATTPVKPAAVPATPAGPPIGTIPATPDEIKKAMLNQATHSIDGQAIAGKLPYLTSLLEKFPSFPEVIAARYGLKTMYDYWSKCGQLLIGARTKATVPSINGLHVIFDNSGNLIVKKEDEFENWINGLNLEKWTSGKLSYTISPKANIIFCRIGVPKPMAGVTEYKKYDVLVNGKTATRYAYIFMGSGNDRRPLSEFGEAGKTIETAIATEFLLIGKSAEQPKNYFSVTIEIPKLLEYGVQDTVEKNVFLSYVQGKNIEQIKKITADETKTEEGEKKPFSIDKKWDNLAFEVDKADLTSAHTAAIDDLVKQVKDTVTKDGIKGITVDELRIISSASNYYGVKVKPTHNNDGSENSEYGKYSGTEDPAPGKDHKSLSTGAEKNNKLAWSRGEAFSRVLMEKLNSDEELIKLGIKFGEPKIEWRITDTGGVIDKNNVNKKDYPNPGQYVQVTMGVKAYTQEKKVTELPGKEGKLNKLEYLATAIRFSPAPGAAGISSKTTTINWQKLQTK